ncbi:WRAP73 [Symbiodinium necroappetens]|uniref:WRAP73 protein n=1 Tax=Symbiodinium necroappetens TaxID=1628268 RepID=A0A812MZC2_9DINO|nr:WRAP73 [Symbiodinium necroappetens]
MASFSQDVNPVTMEAITSAYGYPDHLDTTVAINIYNPSYISAHLDTPTHFNITQRGRPFGTAVVQEAVCLARARLSRTTAALRTLAIQMRVVDFGPVRMVAVGCGPRLDNPEF